MRRFTMLLALISAVGCTTQGGDQPQFSGDAAPPSRTDSATPDPNPDGGGGVDGGTTPDPGSDAGHDGNGDPDGGSSPGEPGEADAGPAPPTPSFDVETSRVDARSVTLAWPEVEDAQSVTVYLGPEPPAEWEGPLPDQVEIASPEPSATSHQIGGLAPNVHHFFRVVVEGANQTHAGNAHAKTIGGPNPAPENDRLDGPIREVLGATPNMLDVVVTQTDVWVGDGRRAEVEDIHGVQFDDPRGGAYQSGPWTIERLGEGGSIPVRTVHRRSMPVGTPRGTHVIGVDDDRSSVETALDRGGAFPPETWHEVRTHVVNIDHHIFLELDEPLGQRGVFRITGPEGIEMIVPFSDRYLPTASVQLNQVGYSPRASRRYAYLSRYLGDGGWVQPDDLPDSVEVLDEPQYPLRRRETLSGFESLPVDVRTQSDPDFGGPVMAVDLSELPAKNNGYYRIRVPGVGVSWRTTVSKWAIFKAFYVTARGMFLNRWGGNLEPEYTDWSRPPDHPYVYVPDDPRTDFFKPPSEEMAEAARAAAESNPSKKIRMRGGYHDAGDYDQRPMHTRVPQFLLRLYEQNREAFTDRQLTIPGSGNGIPDILDEALWGVKAWQKFQRDDGCVRMGAETFRHPPLSLAHLDDLPYVTYACNVNITARAAGLFAQGARLVEQWDAERADQLLDDARAAWRYAVDHGAHDTFRMYAAGELYRATGEEEFRQQFESLASSWDGALLNTHVPTEFDVNGGHPYPGFFMGYLGGPDAQQSIRDKVLGSLDPQVDQLPGRYDAFGHRNPRPVNHNLGWGQATVPMRYLNGLAVRRELGGVSEEKRQRMFDYLSMAADYVLGANPLGMSVITKLGTRYPQNPLWTDSIAFQHAGEGHMPGFPVYGPFGGLPYYADSMKEAFRPSFGELPQGLQWADLSPVAPLNESTIWESQAPLTHLFGLLVPEGMKPPPSWKPTAVAGGENHDNPLPF